ncbi:MAG: hypothetical protein KBD10_00865 [Candidatus Pacebacteria bacterium]|nr:hypothetical protein [Candidatus Paceibacterota bacterium]
MNRKLLLLVLVLAIFLFLFKTDLKNIPKETSLAAAYSVSQKNHTGEIFGGQVIRRLECDCEKNKSYAVQINEYVSKSNIWLKVDPQSKIYEHYQLKPNRYTLGTYNVGGLCFSTKVDPQCKKPLKVKGIINHGPGAGTSL